MDTQTFYTLPQAQKLLKGLKRVTAIGGGHGLGRLLSSLSFLNNRLVGVVATTDNGGSTGLLRTSHACIAWGDIRNCLSQLAQQPLATELLNYRFESNAELKGHNFGNLLLYTLNELSARPLDAIKILSSLCKVRSCILPMSEVPVDLIAKTADNLTCFGEVLVDSLQEMPSELSLSKEVKATPEVTEHLLKSELVILGPGSFLTSITPPLLVPDIQAALQESKAKIIYIDNLMPEHSPAKHLSLDDKVNWLEQFLGKNRLHAVLSNKTQEPTLKPPKKHYQVFYQLKSDQKYPHRHHKDSLVLGLAEAYTCLSDS